MSSQQLGSHLLQSCLATFESQKKLADRSLGQVDDAGLFWAPSPESNSIAVIVRHLSGNLKSRWTDFLTADGEKPDRNRDGEFELPPGTARQDVLSGWEEDGRRSGRPSIPCSRRICSEPSSSAASGTPSSKRSSARSPTSAIMSGRSCMPPRLTVPETGARSASLGEARTHLMKRKKAEDEEQPLLRDRLSRLQPDSHRLLPLHPDRHLVDSEHAQDRPIGNGPPKLSAFAWMRLFTAGCTGLINFILALVLYRQLPPHPEEDRRRTEGSGTDSEAG